MSPEIASQKNYDGLKSDMWAAGILLFAMLFGYQPFVALNEKALLKNIQKAVLVLPSMYQVQHTTRSYSPKASFRSGSVTGRRKRRNTIVEKFQDYPDIENATTICNILQELLQADEAKRASAREIQQKYHNWLSGKF